MNKNESFNTLTLFLGSFKFLGNMFLVCSFF